MQEVDFWKKKKFELSESRIIWLLLFVVCLLGIGFFSEMAKLQKLKEIQVSEKCRQQYQMQP